MAIDLSAFGIKTKPAINLAAFGVKTTPQSQVNIPQTNLSAFTSNSGSTPSVAKPGTLGVEATTKYLFDPKAETKARPLGAVEPVTLTGPRIVQAPVAAANAFIRSIIEAPARAFITGGSELKRTSELNKANKEDRYIKEEPIDFKFDLRRLGYIDEKYITAGKEIQNRVAKGESPLVAFLNVVPQKSLDVAFGAQVISSLANSLSQVLRVGTGPAKVEAWKILGKPAPGKEKEAYLRLAQKYFPDKPTGNADVYKVVKQAWDTMEKGGPTAAEKAKYAVTRLALEPISRETTLNLKQPLESAAKLLKPDVLLRPNVFPLPSPVAGALPGYRPINPNQQPVGLSTNPVEPVGFGDDLAKKVANVKATIKDADAIAAFKIDASTKDMVFAKGDILKPEFAAGRIDDVAQKLNSLQPGLGEVFRQGINPNKTTFKELVTTSNKLVETLIKGKPTISPAVAGIRPALSEIFKSIERDFQTIHEGGVVKIVKGEPVKIVDGVDTFLHKDENGNWAVSEATTGRNLTGGGYENKNFAIKEAKANIEAIGIDKVKQLIAENKLPQSTPKSEPLTLGDNLKVTDAYGTSYLGFNMKNIEKRANEQGYPLYDKLIKVDGLPTQEAKVDAMNSILDDLTTKTPSRFDLARQARDKYIAETLAEERPFKIREAMDGKAPEEILTEYKKDIVGYQESGLGRIDNPQPVNAALTRLNEWKDLPSIKEEVRSQINEAIKRGDIKTSQDGDLVVYRVGRIPTEERLTSVTFSKDFPERFILNANPADKTITELKINPNDVGVYIGGDESELLVSSKSLQSKTKIGEIQPELQPRKEGLSPESSSRPLETKNVSSPDITTTSNAVKAITEALKKAKPIRGKQEALYSAERARRVGVLSGMKAKGEQGFFQQLGVLKGELPKAQFESIRKAVTQENIDELFNIIENANITIFEKISAKNGLARLLGAEGGIVPTKGELELLSEIFPPEFIKSILDQRPLLQRLWGGALNLLNLPRAVMATADLSAPLRQGIFLVGRPKKFLPAFGAMFKYALSEKAYQGLMAEIRSRPTYLLMRENKLALTDMGEVLNAREEAFMSNLAEKIPGFKYVARGSNRAYSGFLNKLRADVFDDLLKKAKQLGIETPNLARDIARFVNSATGRGELPGSIRNATQVLNAIFFSPRLMASRINLLNPAYYITLDPFVRKEALKSLLTFAGIGATIIGLASMAGLDVGTDPRSTDFGKLKTGDTRYDPWGGFQQYIVIASRLITGKMVSSTTGREFNLGEGYKPTTRLDIVQRFFENKTSPVASFALALLKGQTATGEAVNIPAEVIDRFLPMLAQDVFDLVRENGLKGIGMAIPGVFGVGSQTYADQVPMKGKTASGRDTTKWRQAPSLGETILNKVTGKEISTIPEEERAGLAEERLQELIHQANVDRAKKIVLETGKEMVVDGTRVYLDDGIVKTKTSKAKNSSSAIPNTTPRPSLDDIFGGNKQKRPTLESIFSQ